VPPVGKPETAGNRGGTGPSARRGSPPSTVSRNGTGAVDGVGAIDGRGSKTRTLPSARSRGSADKFSKAADKSRVAGQRNLGRLARKDPKAASDLLAKGRGISVATETAARTAVAVGMSVATGSTAGTTCYWDPCSSWTNQCQPFWNWWWSPYGCWWWSSYCCYPGWGWGYCGYPYSGYYGCGWNGWYAAYPVYYAGVVYDSYQPAPVSEVVYAEQPAASESAEPAAMGEGSIEVRGEAAGPATEADRGGLQGRVTLHLTQGDEAFRAGRYSDAVHEYAKAVELQPDQGVLHLILSDALFATGDYHYAAYALRRALELDPTLAESVVDKRSFYGDPADFDRQLELLERYLGDHFLDDDARLLLAANYLFARKTAQAADLLGSPFSLAMRESPAGRLLLDRANALQHGPATPPAGPK